MNHPKYYPGYKSRYSTNEPQSYHRKGNPVEYLVILRSPHIEVANIDEEGRFWEIWPDFTNTETKFPSLDEALRYAEAKMALGMLGERE